LSTITAGTARRMGKKDGRSWRWRLWPFLRTPKDAMPPKDQTSPAEYELGLKKLAEERIQRISIAWEDLCTKLKPDYTRTQEKVNTLEVRTVKESDEAKAAKAEYDKTSAAFFELEGPGLSHSWMLFWLFVIGIVEFPLNGLVFSIFGEREWLTYLFAGILCFMIPLLAHWLGHKLRQERKTDIDRLLIAIGISLIVLVLLVLGFLRAKYLAAALSQFDIGVAISPAMATLVFLILNAGAFFVALIISYAATHPRHAVYIATKARLEEARENLKKEVGEEEAYLEQLEEAKQELREKFEFAKKKWAWHKEGANEARHISEYVMSNYRRANLEARPAADAPSCLGSSYPKPLPEIPRNLTEFDWEEPVIK